MKMQKAQFKTINIFLLIFLLSANLQAQDISYDKKIGKEANVEIISTVGLYRHTFRGYIKQIGQRLVSNLDNRLFDYRFNILDMVEPNAMALPGGYVYFSLGIIPLANSEAELAGVMGHEIIHAHKRHSIKAMRRGIFPAILQIPGELIKVVVSPQLGSLINSPIKYTSKLFSSNYSRSNEKEADKLGTALAAKSGYDPLALIDILDRLEKATMLATHEERKFSFFDSHPMTKTRIEGIRKKAGKLKVEEQKAIVPDKKAFLRKMDGIRISENPANGIFHKNVFLHPDMGFVMEFPKDWITTNSPEMVGAVDTTKSAQLFMGVKKEQKAPSFYAQEAKKELPLNEVVLVNDKKTTINGNDAYIVSIKSKDPGQEIIIHMLWINFGKYTFEILAAGNESYNETLKKTVFSLRKITNKERNSIRPTILRIVPAKAGETIEELSKRTNNVLGMDYLCIINEIKPETKLKSGQLIKIGKAELYKN